MTTYYAITSMSPQDPFIVAAATAIVEAREAAEVALGLTVLSDIYAITKANNMRVYSRTAARRQFGARALEAMEEAWVAAVDAALDLP